MKQFLRISMGVLWASLPPWLYAGCANTATCDPDQELRNGICLPRGSAPAAQASDAGTAGEGGSDAACGTPSADREFGRTCVGDGECGCLFCAIPPGTTEGFCTDVCPDDPSICPAGWSCVDLSTINPDYPKTCLQNP